MIILLVEPDQKNQLLPYDKPLVSFEEFYRVAGFRCVQRFGSTIRHCHLPHTPLVHLYFLSDTGLSPDPLHDPGFLDEYPELHMA